MDGIPGFIVLVVLLSLTPGPDDVLVLRNALHGGARLGVLTAAGAATGSLLWGLTAAAGLAAVLTAAPASYAVVHALGGGYLVVLGALTVRPHLRRRAPALPGPVDRTGPTTIRARSAYASGLLADLLNPKIGLFYLAVLPGFVPAGAPVLQYSMLLSAIDVAVATAWLVTVAVLATALVTRLRRPRVTACLDCGSGIGLLGMGTALAVGA
jgi:threonine/homoserine/homoserine lactone efflux protein